MNSAFYFLTVLAFSFSLGSGKNVSNCESDSYVTISSLGKNGNGKSFAKNFFSRDTIDGDTARQNDYKSVNIGACGNAVMVFTRDSIQQSPSDYLLKCMEEWNSQKQCGFFLVLGKSPKGIWVARGICNDGSGYFSLDLVLCGVKEKLFPLMKPNETDDLDNDSLKNSIASKIKFLLKDEGLLKIIPATDYKIEQPLDWSSKVISIYDGEKNGVHEWDIDYTTTMCWFDFSWEYNFFIGKKLSD